MTESHFNRWQDQLQSLKGFEAMIKSQEDVDSSLKQAQAFAEKIKEETILPEGMVTPDAEMLTKMAAFVTEFKKKNRRASKRNIRRAVCRKFNLTIIPDQIEY